jgi:hypothetical protein
MEPQTATRKLLPRSSRRNVLWAPSISSSRIITCMMILVSDSIERVCRLGQHASVGCCCMKTLVHNVDLILCISAPAFLSDLGHVPPSDRLRTTDVEDVDAAPIQNYLVVMNHQSTARLCTARAKCSCLDHITVRNRLHHCRESQPRLGLNCCQQTQFGAYIKARTDSEF